MEWRKGRWIGRTVGAVSLILTLGAGPASATLDQTLTYAGGTLTLGYSVGTTQAVIWNLYANIQNASPRLLSAPLPPIDPPVPVSIPIPGFPAIGNIGYLTTFSNAAGIVESDWDTIDTAPPTIASCSLDLALTHAGNTLTMDFDLSSGQAATWNIWLVVYTTAIPVVSLPVPALPLINVPLPIPGFPNVGVVGVLTTLTTPAEGIICSDWQTVDTN
jgi:hypothetical protein